MRSTLRVLRMLVSGKQCHNTVSHSRLHTASYANNMTTLGGAQDINEPGLASRLRLAVVRLNRRLRAQRDVEAVATLTQLSAMACCTGTAR